MSDSTQYLMSHGNAVLFGVVFAEEAGLPLPAAPWLLAAGALSASGTLNPFLAVGIVMLASMMGDWIWFFVGRRGGQRVLRRFCRWSLAPCACRGRTKDLFARYGLYGLVAAKFIPGLGAIMPPMAGALGVSTRRFLMFDGLGSLFYGTFYIVAGFLFHTQVQKAMSVLNEFGIGVALAALVSVVGYLAFKFLRRVFPTLRKHAAIPKGTLAGGLVDEPHTAFHLNGSQSLAEMADVALAQATAVATARAHSHGIGANLIREAFGVRGIPALFHAESGGMHRTPNAPRVMLAPVAADAASVQVPSPLIQPTGCSL
jgi:membrane protein DedA with SNARE-associated domain